MEEGEEVTVVVEGHMVEVVVAMVGEEATTATVEVEVEDMATMEETGKVIYCSQ